MTRTGGFVEGMEEGELIHLKAVGCSTCTVQQSLIRIEPTRRVHCIPASYSRTCLARG